MVNIPSLKFSQNLLSIHQSPCRIQKTFRNNIFHLINGQILVINQLREDTKEKWLVRLIYGPFGGRRTRRWSKSSMEYGLESYALLLNFTINDRTCYGDFLKCSLFQSVWLIYHFSLFNLGVKSVQIGVGSYQYFPILYRLAWWILCFCWKSPSGNLRPITWLFIRPL